MENRVIFALSLVGALSGLAGAFFFGLERKTQPPVFEPVRNPYDTAIYANGIVESAQANGANVNIFPEVSGPVTQILVREGEAVAAGAPLFVIDDIVQRPTTEQLRAQSEAALVALQALKALPRPEVLAVAKAQVVVASAALKTARDQFDKRLETYKIDPKSISKDVFDTAKNSLNQAIAGFDLAQKQYDLVRIGAWSFDVLSQEKQVVALQEAYQSAKGLLAKYTVRAQSTGVVLAVNAAVGSTASTQGIYDSYTEGLKPAVVMSGPQSRLAIRCYVDEILISRLPDAAHIRAEMAIRGTTHRVPLEFVRIQPYVSPKIALSNQRQERVDLRVLPVIFRFETKNVPGIYPGQLADVFIGQK